MRFTRFLSALAILALMAVPVLAAPVIWGGNDHGYDFVPGSFGWFQARDAAVLQTFRGVPGHLVTITSGSENAFLINNLGTAQPFQVAWTGGREPGDDGVWIWDVGPEAGIQYSFWSVATPPLGYAAWGGIEPNDLAPTEDYMTFNIGLPIGPITSGAWSDSALFPSAADPVIGYIVEFGPPAVIPEPTTLALFGLGLAGLVAWRRKRRKAA